MYESDERKYKLPEQIAAGHLARQQQLVEDPSLQPRLTDIDREEFQIIRDAFTAVGAVGLFTRLAIEMPRQYGYAWVELEKPRYVPQPGEMPTHYLAMYWNAEQIVGGESPIWQACGVRLRRSPKGLVYVDALQQGRVSEAVRYKHRMSRDEQEDVLSDEERTGSSNQWHYVPGSLLDEQSMRRLGRSSIVDTLERHVRLGMEQSTPVRIAARGYDEYSLAGANSDMLSLRL